MNTQNFLDHAHDIFRAMMASAVERRLHRELGAGEMSRIYHELGVDRQQFRGLLLSNGEWRERLPRMMRRFGVEPKQVTDGAVMRDMERVCAGCPAQRRCARALANGANADSCAAFCPNAGTFEALVAA